MSVSCHLLIQLLQLTLLPFRCHPSQRLFSVSLCVCFSETVAFLPAAHQLRPSLLNAAFLYQLPSIS